MKYKYKGMGVMQNTARPRQHITTTTTSATEQRGAVSREAKIDVLQEANNQSPGAQIRQL